MLRDIARWGNPHVAMPSLSEGNLDLKIGYLDHGFPQKPEISGL